VAFEVARQLVGAGETVGLLVVWETLAPRHDRHRALLRVLRQVRAVMRHGAAARLGPGGLRDLARHGSSTGSSAASAATRPGPTTAP
jgi:thioesterase domain-containing protein